MKFWLLLLFCGISVKICAQGQGVAGIVFEKESEDRIAKVNIRNITNGQSVYNNLKGEFKISAQPGDLLVFTKENYHPDTIKLQSYTPLAVYLHRIAIQLKQVTIRDAMLTPEQRLAATKNDYTKIYGSLGNHDLLSISPGGGAGLSIDALYNAFSRSGRNAAKLQEIIQRDYYQNVIDYRFNKTFVGNITGLKGDQLTDFMMKYRPGYYLVNSMSDYEFIGYIRANLKRYLRNPKALSLSPLSGNGLILPQQQ